MRSVKFLGFMFIVLLISGKFMFPESHSNVIGKVIDEDTKKGVPVFGLELQMLLKMMGIIQLEQMKMGILYYPMLRS
jgi:hypothetical protein